MNLFSDIFNTLLYWPLLNILILLYEYLPGHDFGVAVIVLTILIRLVLYPLMAQTIRSRENLSKLQPKIKDIQEKFKDNQEKQAKEMMNLYREEKISPFSSFLPLLIQLPLLIALFQVFSKGLQIGEMNSLYGFIPHPEAINYVFLGIINLSEVSMPLAILAAVVQFFQIKMQNPKTKIKKTGKKDKVADFSKIAQKQMPYFLSAFTLIFLSKLPAALGLYLIITSLFSIGQEHIFKKHAQSK